jgi:hypothetical protein
MKVELEMEIEQENGTVVLHKLSELANKAKELGFIVTEAEIESEDEEKKKTRRRMKVKKSSLKNVKALDRIRITTKSKPVTLR